MSAKKIWIFSGIGCFIVGVITAISIIMVNSNKKNKRFEKALMEDF